MTCSSNAVPASAGRSFNIVTASRHANMKELRTGTTRTLFAFNPKRTAILLIGGDKRDRWQDFYTEMIPLADDLFDEHLKELESKGAP